MPVQSNRAQRPSLPERADVFRVIAENVEDLIALVDLNGRRLYNSPSYRRVLGDEAALAGTDSFREIHPEDRERIRQVFAETVRSGRGQRAEFRFLLPDGSVRYIESQGNLIADGAGSPQFVLIVSRDVTERREAESRTRLLAHALSCTRDAFCLCDLSGRILFVNGAFCSTYQYTEEELVGRSITIVQADGDAPELLGQAFTTVASGGWNGELLNRKKDGTTFPVELWTSPVLDDRGTPVAIVGIARDVSERLKTMALLREGETRFRSLIENSTDGISMISAEGETLYLSSSTGKILGYSVEDYRGKSEMEFVHPDDRPGAERLAQEVLRTPGSSVSGQYRMRHRDGSWHWLDIVKTNLLADPAVGAIVVNFRDATTRKRSEDLQSAVYRIGQAADAATSLDELYRSLHQIVRSVMPAQNFYIALYDEKEDLLSFPYFVDEVDPPAPPQKAGRGLTEYVLRTGKSLLCDRALDEEMQRRGQVDLVGTSSPIWLGVPLIVEGKAIGVMTVQHYTDPNAYGLPEQQVLEFVSSQIARAIDKKRAEEALRESEQKFRTLFEESKDGIFISTPEGRLIDVNPAGVALFGCESKDDLLKSDIGRDLYANAADRETFKRELDVRGFVTDFEFEIKRADGDRRSVLESASAVKDAAGRVRYYRGFVRDITERKRLEEQLRQAQKMESIGTLAGGIAHDFNNLLGIILGYATRLEDADADRGKISSSVDTIKKAVDRGADLVRQLLTFARRSDSQFESVNVNETVRELVRMLRQTLPKDIEVSTLLHEPMPAAVADAAQVHQALLNLSVNARDAIEARQEADPSPGELSFISRIVTGEELRGRFAEATGAEYVHLSVRDNGIGMDEATRGRMFEPFFTTKEVGRGTGLGLSVVYGVVNNHRGHIEVESELGKGTTFHLYLPLQARMLVPMPEPQPQAQAGKGGSETILVVEDEEMLLSLLQGMLEDHGYRVLTAADGQQGLDIYQAHHRDIDLVVTDMGLPRLGGWEMFAKMKGINPQVKAILASGYLDPKIKAEMVAEGAKDFVQKPYVSELILRRIREILDE